MTQFQVKVTIDSAILEMSAPDSLLIARKVNGKINAVFAGFNHGRKNGWDQLLHNVIFRWKDDYRVFLANELATASTEEVDIEPGMMCNFEHSVLKAATLQPPDFFPIPGSFGVGHVPNNLHVGVMMMTADGSWKTIYFDRDNHMAEANIVVKPQEEYFLFWRHEAAANVFYDLEETLGHKIVFQEGETEKSVRFGFAQPSQPDSADESPSWH